MCLLIRLAFGCLGEKGDTLLRSSAALFGSLLYYCSLERYNTGCKQEAFNIIQLANISFYHLALLPCQRRSTDNKRQARETETSSIFCSAPNSHPILCSI